METVFLEAIFYQLFKSSLSVTMILRCIGVVTSIVIFPCGIIVLILYFCGHKCSGTDNTVGREGWMERGREGGEGWREEGRERGRERERERERGRVIMGMVESFREKEGNEQKKNGKKNAILSKNMPFI